MKNFTILSVLILLLFSCSKKNGPKSGEKVITKFVFTKANNPSLTEDIEGVITGNEIKVVLHGITKNNLKPTITYTSKNISSNEQAKDFTNPVIYTLTAEDGSTVNYTVKVESRDVYIGGTINIGTTRLPVYWKNGNKIDLPLANYRDGNVTGVVVNGNDVYVAGTVSGSAVKAVYWKNGTMIELAPNSTYSRVLDIKLYNGDVYILGNVYGTNVTNNYVYWKNGVETVVIDNTNNTISDIADCLLVDGNDVYAGGVTFENGINKAAYWKNGNKVVVSNEESYIESLIKANNDLYAFGKVNSKSGFYWKNGTKNTYSFPGDYYVYNSAIVGSDIHMVGEYYDAIKDIYTAAYFKNGLKTNLTDGIQDGYALDITAVENDIYIAGGIKNLNNNYSPIYWINGKKTIINSESDCTINSIFVKSN